MQPVADTRKLLKALSDSGQPEVEASLLVLARRAQTLVPQCVGLSVALVRENLTFTLVPTSAKPLLSVRPASQRLSTSAVGDHAVVASSLSMPIVESDAVVAHVTVYAATKAAFEGRLEMIAAALGASSLQARTDSDLSFRSRAEARASWLRFVEQVDVDVALGIVAASYDISIGQADERLERAAQRAGVSRPQAARVVRHLR